MEPPQPGEWQCPSPDLSSGDTKNGCCEYQLHWEGDLISIDGGKTKKHQQTAELHRKKPHSGAVPKLKKVSFFDHISSYNMSMSRLEDF